MAPFDTPDRPRAAEDDYFRRQDEELLASARESQRVSRGRQALAQALGSADDESVERLYANGLRASTAVAVEWLPAVNWPVVLQEVSWASARSRQRSGVTSSLFGRTSSSVPDRTGPGPRGPAGGFESARIMRTDASRLTSSS